MNSNNIINICDKINFTTKDIHFTTKHTLQFLTPKSEEVLRISAPFKRNQSIGVLHSSTWHSRWIQFVKKDRSTISPYEIASPKS